MHAVIVIVFRNVTDLVASCTACTVTKKAEQGGELDEEASETLARPSC